MATLTVEGPAGYTDSTGNESFFLYLQLGNLSTASPVPSTPFLYAACVRKCESSLWGKHWLWGEGLLIPQVTIIRGKAGERSTF